MTSGMRGQLTLRESTDIKGKTKEMAVLLFRLSGVGLIVLPSLGCVPLSLQEPPKEFENEDVERAYYDLWRPVSHGVYINFKKQDIPDASEGQRILRLARKFGLSKPQVREFYHVVQWSMEWPYWRFDEEGEAFCNRLDERMGKHWRGECQSNRRAHVWPEPLPRQRDTNCSKTQELYSLALNERDDEVLEWASQLGSCPELDEWLFEAVRHGHLRAVTRVLARGVAIDARDGAGWTALHLALVGMAGREADDDVKRRAEIVSVLLDAGAEVNSTTDLVAWTPLHLAATLGNQALVAMLLEQGARVNAQTRLGGWTPLYVAVLSEAGSGVIAALEAEEGRYEYRDYEKYRVYSDGYGRWTELPFAAPKKMAGGYSLRGTFVEPQTRERLANEYGKLTRPEAQERLVVERFGETEEGKHLWAVGVIDGGGVVHQLWVTDHSSVFMDLCRDYPAGLDHVSVVRKRTNDWRGNEAEFWRYDKSDRRFALGYSFEILYRETESRQAATVSRNGKYAAERTLEEILRAYQQSSAYAKLGYCRWKDRKAAAGAFTKALDTLQVGKLPTFSADGSVAFPTRTIDSLTAERLLPELRDLPADIVEIRNGGVVSERANDDSVSDGSPAQGAIESDRWEIILIAGADRGPDGQMRSDEFVLVHDKVHEAWQSIYDCTDLEIHELRGNVLTADFPNNVDGCGSDLSDSLHSMRLNLEYLQPGSSN